MFLIKLEHFEKCLETFFAGVGFFSEILILQVIFGQIPKKFMKYFEKKKNCTFCAWKDFLGNSSDGNICFSDGKFFLSTNH